MTEYLIVKYIFYTLFYLISIYALCYNGDAGEGSVFGLVRECTKMERKKEGEKYGSIRRAEKKRSEMGRSES